MRIACMIVAAVILTGCETYKPAYTTQGFVPTKLKRVYIVKNLTHKKDKYVYEYLAQAFSKRGVSAIVIDPNEKIPADADAYVNYNDRWVWDLTMYLDVLQVWLHDAHTKEVAASAEYKQGFVHSYPEVERIAEGVVGQLYGETPASRSGAGKSGPSGKRE